MCSSPTGASGRAERAPLLLLNYFAAHMDDWDPKMTNGFAAEHDVILVDYPGIGRSSGQTPSTVAALTNALRRVLSRDRA